MCCVLYTSQNMPCYILMQHASCPATADHKAVKAFRVSTNVSIALDVQQLQPLPYCLPSPTPSATGCLSALQHASFQEASTSCAPSFKCHSAISNQEQCSEAAALSVAWPISQPSPPCLSGDYPSVNGTTPIWSL